MKNIGSLFFFSAVFAGLFASCSESKQDTTPEPINWQQRAQEVPAFDSLTSGTTYLSVYSQIYSYKSHQLQDLTVTISMRNTNRADTIYLTGIEYYATSGDLLRSYIDCTVILAPLETIEIIIEESDRTGGSGANFLFDWTTEAGVNEPFFEAVMISMRGGQGLSFVTEGKRTE